MTVLERELVTAIVEVYMQGDIELDKCIEHAKSILKDSQSNYAEHLSVQMLGDW